LTKAGLMRPAGAAAFQKRDEKKSAIYSYEEKPGKLSLEFEKQFKKNKAAWKSFQGQPPWYKRRVTHFVMSAKHENTRISRLEKLILASEAGERL